MARIFRWLVRLFTGLVAIALATLAVSYWLASRSLPDYDASFRLDGVEAPVEIVRSNANVPHIFGESEVDSFFALGFAHAQDRLWQMTMLRRTAQGRLSELFGTRTLRTDTLMRRLDIQSAARRSVEALDDDTRAMLDAYSAGVNAWIEQVNAGARGRGAPEFFLFSNAVAPWQPADSVAIVKLMALQLSGHLRKEVQRARLSLAVPEARVADLMPEDPSRAVAALPEYAALVPGLERRAAEAEPPGGTDFLPVQPAGREGASNAWAAGPSRSTSGGTLMANDPHLGLSAPTLWYLARIELPTGGVIGGTIPGVPVVLTGRSAALGWGLTSSYMDDLDLHVERLNPDNREEALTPDGWKPLSTRRSVIEVNGSEPVEITLRWSENGPILSGSDFELSEITPQGHVMSVSWTALSPNDTTLQAALNLMRAGTVEEAIEASADYIAPSQNLILVDNDTIALQTAGAMPRRAAGHQTEGRMPAPGWRPENRWQGRMDFAENPQFVAPEGGILGNTNNKTVDRPFPRHVSHDWGDTQRIQRWRTLMQNREVHTRESFIEAQLDTVSPTARALLPLIGADLWFTGEAAPEGTDERRRQRALDLLADWNGDMSEHLPEPLIYAAWLRALQARLIEDELGPLADSFARPEPVFIERVYRDVDGASEWCNVHQSSVRESCAEIARLALDDALLWLDETYGGALESLRWGDAHEAAHDHPVLGETPILRWFVNIRQSTSGGDNTLMRGVTSGEEDAPFRNVHGAGYRGVYDFDDPDSSVFIVSTGQSGHPLSQHYDDLGQLWRAGEYIPMSLDPELARAAAVGVTRLRPR